MQIQIPRPNKRHWASKEHPRLTKDPGHAKSFPSSQNDPGVVNNVVLVFKPVQPSFWSLDPSSWPLHSPPWLCCNRCRGCTC